MAEPTSKINEWRGGSDSYAVLPLPVSYNSQSGKGNKAREREDGSRRKISNGVNTWGIRGDGCAGTMRRRCEAVCDCEEFGFYV